MLHVSTLSQAIIRCVNKKSYEGRYDKKKSKGPLVYNNCFLIAPKYRIQKYKLHIKFYMFLYSITTSADTISSKQLCFIVTISFKG
jgi:hypothetical protein